MSAHTQSIFPKHRFLTEDESDWYESIISNALSSFYCTFTFKYRIHSQQAHKTFDAFVASLAEKYKENIAYIMAEEMKLPGKVQHHLQAVLFTNVLLTTTRIEDWWSHGIAEVENYKKGGVGHILKKTPSEHCNWKLSDNIWLFAPGYTPKNKKERDTLKRHLERKETYRTLDT